MGVIPAWVRARGSPKPAHPAAYAADSVAPGNHRGTLTARRAGAAGPGAVFPNGLWHTQITVYVAWCTSRPTDTRSPVYARRCSALWLPFKAEWSKVLERIVGSFQIPVDSFNEPLAVIRWRSQP
jgi:hypothetical protein